MASKRKQLIAAAAAFAALSGGATMVSALVPDPIATGAAATVPSVAEYRRTIDAMKPPKRARPLIAVLGDNRGTEAIDFLVPYSVLQRSGVADVVAVGMTDGPLKLRPALTIEAELDAAGFERRFPAGADYVVVPAMSDHRDASVIAWIRSQEARGATIVAICAGAEILANGGLLWDRAATTHWASVRNIIRSESGVRWTPHRRYVADRSIVTTTGVSAAIPVSIALVEAIAGPARARSLAIELGVEDWGQSHDSSAYRIGGDATVLLANRAAAWKHEDVGIPVAGDVDDIALALTADSWSRTFRSKAWTMAAAPRLRTRSGLTLIVDRRGRGGIERILAPVAQSRPARALRTSLRQIASAYGARTARLVAMQLEYDGRS